MGILDKEVTFYLSSSAANVKTKSSYTGESFYYYYKLQCTLAEMTGCHSALPSKCLSDRFPPNILKSVVHAQCECFLQKCVCTSICVTRK